jgi:hypothetical protein
MNGDVVLTGSVPSLAAMASDVRHVRNDIQIRGREQA